MPRISRNNYIHLELVVDTEQDVCSVKVKTERINLCIMILSMLVSDETYMSDKVQVVCKLNCKTRFETNCEYIRINIFTAIQMFVTNTTVNEYINNLRMEECITCIGSYAKSLFTAFIRSFPAERNSNSPVIVKVVTHFRYKFI